jgi:hypothetical protein
MKPEDDRAKTTGRKMSPRRRHNAAAHRQARKFQTEDKIILIAAMCAGYLRGEMKSCVRLAL